MSGDSLQASQVLLLGWDASAEKGLDGYIVHYGEIYGGVTNLMTVGKTTTAPVPGLEEGKNYFFFVTAFNLNGSQGTPSNVVVYRVPSTSEGPKLETIMDQVVEGGRTLSVQAKATSGDPAQGETVFSLRSDSGDGATLDPKTGVFTWNTTRQPSTNKFVIQVTQEATAAPSDEVAFTVVVMAEGSVLNPGDPAQSPPRLAIQTGRSSSGEPKLLIQWPAQVGSSYRVEYKESVDTTAWIPLASVVTQSTAGVFEDSFINPRSSGFYRVISE